MTSTSTCTMASSKSKAKSIKKQKTPRTKSAATWSVKATPASTVAWRYQTTPTPKKLTPTLTTASSKSPSPSATCPSPRRSPSTPARKNNHEPYGIISAEEAGGGQNGLVSQIRTQKVRIFIPKLLIMHYHDAPKTSRQTRRAIVGSGHCPDPGSRPTLQLVQ